MAECLFVQTYRSATSPRLIHPQDEWIKHGLSANECEWDLAIQMPAGTETSITAIRATLLRLLSSPSAYQKLKQEIANGIKEGQISRPITYEEAKRLPYLQVSSSTLGPFALPYGQN